MHTSSPPPAPSLQRTEVRCRGGKQKTGFLTIGVMLGTIPAAVPAMVRDPVADSLALPIEGRYTEASEVVRVDKVMVDIDLDGQPEVFVGHHKMWLGDNTSVYFSVYKMDPSGGYLRLTPANQDIALAFRDGVAKFNYVGRVEELGTTGLLIFNPPHGDSALSSQRIETRQYLSISDGEIMVRDLPGLDLADAADNAFFEEYSGQEGQQDGSHRES